MKRPGAKLGIPWLLRVDVRVKPCLFIPGAFWLIVEAYLRELAAYAMLLEVRPPCTWFLVEEGNILRTAEDAKFEWPYVRLLAAEILIRGIVHTMWSSLTTLPTAVLNWVTCCYLAWCIISVTFALLYERAFIASRGVANSFLGQHSPELWKLIFLRATSPVGSSSKSIFWMI